MNSHFDLKLDDKGDIASGTLKIIAPDAEINLTDLPISNIGISGFTITRAIKISPLIFELDINKNTYTIKNFSLAGADLNAEITGFAEQGKYGGRIEIDIKVDADSGALSDYKIFLNSFIDSDNKILLPIRGSMQSPRIDQMRMPANRLNNEN